MSALFLFFILYTNNILCSNAQPTLAPTASLAPTATLAPSAALAPTSSSGPQTYTVTQVIGTTKNNISTV